jgi:hypothetical protein
MTQPRSGNDALMSGGGTPWAKLPTIGSKVRGKVVEEPVVKQRRDFDTNEPMVWPNGDPQEEIVVKLATDERDPSIEDDDGVRALHIYNQLKTTVREAVRAAGATGLKPGGDLTVEYTGDGIPKTRGKKPPKEYSAWYVPPVGKANGALMGGGAPAGVDPDTWARMAPEQRSLVQALAGAR